MDEIESRTVNEIVRGSAEGDCQPEGRARSHTELDPSELDAIAAGETPRRGACHNNLKQIGIALF